MALPLYKTVLLKLVSPNMKDGRGVLKGGHLIRDTQYLLNGNSVNKRTKQPFGDYFAGRIDGEYGPYTASAVRLAKYYMGYPNNEINSVAGPTFQAYLRGDAKIPWTYNLRRRSRLKAAALPVREKAFAKALTQIGTHESPPGSNRVLYSEWYGIIGSWCAMFVSWCFVQAGSQRFQRASHYAYVPYVVDDARYGRNGLHLTTNPVKGDLVCYDWNRDGIADHIGIFDQWIDQRAGSFRAVEGNTSDGNWSNGGEVLHTTRFTYQVEAFVHVLEP